MKAMLLHTCPASSAQLARPRSQLPAAAWHGTASRGRAWRVSLAGKAGSMDVQVKAQSFTEREWFQELEGRRAAAGTATAPQRSFRFWHDEKRFKGTGETSLAQRALLAAGGRRTGGNIKSSPMHGPLGSQRKGDWDVLWSPASTAHKALETGLEPGQLCSAVPGTQSLCKKKKLAETLEAAYGDDAFSIVPRTYSLPGQVKQWREWMRANIGKAEGRLWMLKTAQHLGKGLKLVTYQKAVKEMLLQYERAEIAKKHGRAKQVRPFVVAQQYIDNPLLINDRKFGIRVWVVITSIDPLRVYLHQRGLVLFSSDGYDNGSIAEEDGSVSGGHVTNYAQNKDGDVWSLEQLQAHLGEGRYKEMLNQIVSSTALTYAASVAPMRKEATRLGLPGGSCFELMGLDYLIDKDLKPWLLEVNSTPSLAVEHSDAAVERMIFEQKNSMVVDMFKLLQVPERFCQQDQQLIRPGKGPTATSSAEQKPMEEESSSHGKRSERVAEALKAFASDSSVPFDKQVLKSLVESELELQGCAGFRSLLPAMPWDAEQEGWSIPWSVRDRALQDWLRARPNAGC